jgi:hypothetical protein
MLKEPCPYHQGPIKHTMEECVMLRRHFHKAGPPAEGGRAHNNDKKEDHKAEGFPEVHDCFMIYGGPVANASARHRKQERREVCSVKVAAPVYLDWSDKPITFDQGDHPDRVPSSGKYPLVVDPVIDNVSLTKVLMDEGSGLNIIYAETLGLLRIDLSSVRAGAAPFHGIMGCLAALSRFILRLGERGLPLYRLLRKVECFTWTPEAEEALGNLKALLTNAPILVPPAATEALLIYVAATTQVVSAAIVVERREEGHALPVQRPVYFISEVLSKTKICYPQIQKLLYEVILTRRKLRHYFESHPVTVVSSFPLGEITSVERPRVGLQSGRWKSWARQSCSPLGRPSSPKSWRTLWLNGSTPSFRRLRSNRNSGPCFSTGR